MEEKRRRGTQSDQRRRQSTQPDQQNRRRPEPGTGRNRRPSEKELRQMRSSRARKRRRNLILRMLIIFVLVVGIIGGILFWIKYGPSKEMADLNQYYGVSNDDDLAVVINNENLKVGGKMIDGNPYIEYSVLRDRINDRFYWDSNENVLLYTLPNGNVSAGVGSKDYSVAADKKSEDYVILKTEGKTAYVALEFVQKYTNIDFGVYKDSNHVMIVNDWGKTTTAELRRKTEVRYQAGVKSPVLTTVNNGDKVTTIEVEGKWKKVRTSDGFIGYVKQSALKKEKTETISRDFDEPEYTSIKKDYTINLAWDNLENEIANSEATSTLANAKGLTTVSPTWFGIADTDGNLRSIADKDYVNYAHQSNLEVWAMFRDFHDGLETQEDVYSVLSYTSKRETLENQVVAAALEAGIDGINLDFELISEECGESFVQFVRELGVKCRQNGLVFSVDNYVPMPYNEFRNIKEQGVMADYVVIMGYDEHIAGSDKPGSVASYDYVKNGIEDTLKDVPAEKVINAVPFYTRLWSVTSTGVESLDLTMEGASSSVAAAGATAVWDDKTKQNYAEWESDGVTYEIWLEDSASIEEKMKLIKSNKLAGVAEWELGGETPDIWDVILQYVN